MLFIFFFLCIDCSNNNNNKNDDVDDDDDIYGAVIMASHFESSPSSYNEYGTAPSGHRPSAQAKRPGLRVHL